MNYNNAKVYKIYNLIDDDIYVGSTCQSLSKRMAKHRGSMNTTEKSHRPLYSKMLDLGVENVFIELIEECPCESKDQLRQKEGFFIREMGTLNKRIENRSKKEYNQLYDKTHRQEKNQHTRNWRENNKEHVSVQSMQKNTIKHTKNIC